METQITDNKSAMTIDQAKGVNQANTLAQANNVNQNQEAFMVDEGSTIDGTGKEKKKKEKGKGSDHNFNIDLSAQDMIEAIIAAMGESVGWGVGKAFEGADFLINGRFGLATQLAKAIENQGEKWASSDGKPKQTKASEQPAKTDKSQKSEGSIYNPSEKEMQSQKDPMKDLKEKATAVKEALEKAASGKTLNDGEKNIMTAFSNIFAKSSQKEDKTNVDAINRYDNLSQAFGKLGKGETLGKDEAKMISQYSKDFDKKVGDVTKNIENENAKKSKPKNLKEAATVRKGIKTKAKANKKDRKDNKAKKTEVKKEIDANLARKMKLQELSGRVITRETKSITKKQQKEVSISQIKNKSQGR
ncbi:MAG: hypothetical protein AB7U85_10045 [Alphaproteobacteria bacterium]